MCQGCQWVELLASVPVVWHHSLTCDLALALMCFPPLSSDCHCLLHLTHIYQASLQILQGWQILCEDITPGTEPSLPSKGNLLVALFQASCCDKPFSRA